MRRGIAGLVVVLVALAAAACGGDEGDSTGSSSAATEAPTSTAAPATSEPVESTAPTEGSTAATAEPTAAESTADSGATQTAAGEPVPVAIYLVGDEKVRPVRRMVDGAAPARAALEALLAGPTAPDGELTSAIPDGTKLLDVAIDDAGILTVDLSGAFGSGGGSLSMMLRVAQVVDTASQFPTVEGVTFRLDGKPITALGGEGLVLDRPQTPADFEDVTPLVLVQEPLPGDTVTCPIHVRGTSNVFEATSLLGVTATEDELPSDPTVVTATSGTGTRGTFDVDVACTPPASGSGFLASWWASAKDGSAQDVEHIPLSFR